MSTSAKVGPNGVQLAVHTTAERTALSLGTADKGTMIFNSDINSAEFWDGNLWIATNLIPEIQVSGELWDTDTTPVLSFTGTSLTDLVSVEFTYASSGASLLTVENIDASSGSFSIDLVENFPNPTWPTVISAGDEIKITLYNADRTPSNAINKTVKQPPQGGTIASYAFSGSTTSGGYRWHAFTSSGSFTIPEGTFLVEYLVIGGGGAGSKAHSTNVTGGGGAGGYRTSVIGATSGRNTSAESRQTLGPGTYTVTVGAGGTCSTASGNQQGSSGSSSTFNTITASGGGYGGFVGPATGGSGGSGGGAGSYSGSASANYVGGTGTAGQGYDGGDYTNGTTGAGGGGGGGASAEGATQGTTQTGGKGGNGLYNDITGASYPRAGGGGGAGWNANTGGAGGTGGGGAAGTGDTGTAVAGTVNTGGGGGAAKGSGIAGNGGSGVVIVRYRVAEAT